MKYKIESVAIKTKDGYLEIAIVTDRHKKPNHKFAQFFISPDTDPGIIIDETGDYNPLEHDYLCNERREQYDKLSSIKDRIVKMLAPPNDIFTNLYQWYLYDTIGIIGLIKIIEKVKRKG